MRQEEKAGSVHDLEFGAQAGGRSLSFGVWSKQGFLFLLICVLLLHPGEQGTGRMGI